MPAPDFETLNLVALPVFVIDVKPGMRLEFRGLNDAHTAISGMTSDEIAGKTALELFEGRAGRNAWHRHAQVAETGQPLTYVITVPFPSGERAFRTSLIPMKDQDGSVSSIIGTMVEITKQRTLEASTLLAEASTTGRLAESEQFISMAAHDLRTPMRNVRNVAKMLRDEWSKSGAGKHELLDMLEEIGTKASDMIADVLAYSKATTVEERRSRFSLGALCSDLFVIMDPEQKHDLSSDDAQIDSDEVALQIVLRNLVDNALRHGKRERLSLFIALDEEADGLLSFSVRDNGCGLRDISLAFLDTGKFTYDSGFGLLGIRRLLLSRGGEIWAEKPSHDVGTLFRFTLPGSIIGLAGSDQEFQTIPDSDISNGEGGDVIRVVGF